MKTSKYLDIGITLLSILFSSAFGMMPATAEDTTINIELIGLRSQQGSIKVCLWQQKQGFPLCESGSTALKKADIQPGSSKVSVTFSGIPAGEYAVSAFHDENNNGKMDRDVIRRPKEGISLSNLTQISPAAMNFDSAKFSANGITSISLKMFYLK
ncbi:MAG: DUF2141 domain-containing protein [Cyanobacteria bacterium P01_A01_bin.17]